MQNLLQSINSALDRLEKPGPISDEDVHETRRMLKKSRATLRLLRPIIGDVVYRRENVALRNASRSMSRLRDAKAQIDSIAALRKRYPGHFSSAWIALESKADERLERLRSTFDKNSRPVRAATSLIKESKARLSVLCCRAGGRKDLDKSLRRIYRKSSEAFAVVKKRPSMTSLHEWRKKAKYFANAVDVLGGHVSSRADALGQDAVRLADWLGEEHDLGCLMGALHHEKLGLFSSSEKAGLRHMLDARRLRLRRKALRLGKKMHKKRLKSAVK